MNEEYIELRLPRWAEVRTWVRAILGIRPGADEGRALEDSLARRYDDISRCC